MSEGVLVGRVAAVLRYPVKSMAAEPVEDVDVAWHGLSGDRRWAFVRPDLPSNGFPWLTLRQRNDLNDYHPCWTEPERPDASAVLRAIATHRETCLGVYGSTLRPGRVTVGDSVILQP